MEEKKSLKERLKERLKGVSKAAIRKAVIAAEWGMSHKEVMIFIGVVLGSVVEVIKVNTRKHCVSEDRALKERFIYDSRNRHYYETKRKVKNSEWLAIDDRLRQGENLGWILNDMKLLK